MGVYVVGHSEGNGLSVPIPAGTTEMDLCLLIGLSSWRNPPRSLKLEYDDPRMREVINIEGVGDDGIKSRRAWGVWAGHVAEGDQPFALDVRPPYLGQFAQFTSAEVVVLRSDDGSTIDIDFAQIFGRVMPPENGGVPDGSYMPPLPDAGDAGLAITATFRSAPGVFTDFVNPEAVEPDWRVLYKSSNNYFGSTVYASELISVPQSADLRRTDATAGIYAAVMPLRGQTVTRQYPRDDGRGMSSAPRIYPPPKSGRVFGGYQ